MDFLDLENWRVLTREEHESHFEVMAIYDSTVPLWCAGCPFPKFNRHGVRTRTIKDFPFRGKPLVIKLSVTRYRCQNCGISITPKVTGMDTNTRLTARFAEFIFDQCAEKSYSQISRETGVGASTIREIHVRNIVKHEPVLRFPTPRVLGADGVYVRRKDRYILTDIETRRVIGLYESTTQVNVLKYLLDLPDKEKVEIVTMDMSKSFYNAARKAFKSAKIVIDKYHVQRLGKKVIDNFLAHCKTSDINKKTKRSSPAYAKDRFLLYRRKFTHTETQKNQLNNWSKDDADLIVIYDLKERFLDIWMYKDRNEAERAFEEFKTLIPCHLKFAFKEVLSAFRNWYQEIFNYFDYRYTNAFTEAANRKIKMIQKVCSGCSFWTVRAKILWQEYRRYTGDKPLIPGSPQNDCRYTIPRKTQGSLRLRQSCENNSQMFSLMFPKAEWRERFGPYLHLLYKT